MPIELNHKTLSEAINFHETWFEYHLNLAHMAEDVLRGGTAHAASYQEQITKAAQHAAILAELRHHQKGD